MKWEMETLTQSQIAQRIAQVPKWWHTIDIKGVATPGVNNPAAQEWIESAILENLEGKEVLDIGCWDGYYSFYAEAQGAKRVVAIDPSQGPSSAKGFHTAHELLKSKVQFESCDVYELNRIQGQFDVVFFFGVYYHLQDPVLALHNIFQKLKPGGVMILEGLVRSGNTPYLYALRPGVDLSPGDYCSATVPWLTLACKQVGFEPAEFHSRYSGDNWFEKPLRGLAWHLHLNSGKFRKAHRAIVRATKPLKPIYDKYDTEARDLFLANHVSRQHGNA